MNSSKLTISCFVSRVIAMLALPMEVLADYSRQVRYYARYFFS